MKKVKYIHIRLLSILALLLLLNIFISGILLLINNPGLFILYASAGFCLACGVWLMLSGRSRRFFMGVILSAMALIAAVIGTIIFLSKADNTRRFIVLAVSSVAYLAIAGYIANLYWHAKRKEHKAVSIKYAKPVLLINPKSGDGRAIKSKTADHARKHGIEPMVLEPGQDIVRMAERAVGQGANVLGISGGDGSLGAIAQVAIKHDIPMVVVFGGTRCHFARDIGLEPARINDALDGFKGTERRVDVGLIADRVFLNNASFGLYAEIASKEEYRAHKVETTQRVMRHLAESPAPYYPLTFKDGKGKTWRHAALVFVGVNRYETLRLGELGARNKLDEGVLQVIALRALDDGILKHLAMPWRIGAPGDSEITEWVLDYFSISNPSGWLNAGVDGESLRLKSPVNIRIRRKALRLMVPAEGIRHRPIQPISTAGAKTLWGLIWAK